MGPKFIQKEEVLNLYKRLGETPRECLERLRSKHTDYKHDVLSYAGRLDPMAEGVLVCLVGGANKMHNSYLDMSKEYVLDVLFGFSTDTYDILGKVMEEGDPSSFSKDTLHKALQEFRGVVSQEYPPFSSKTVEGKSLFAWARSGELHTIVLPRRDVTIYDISITNTYKLSEPALLAYIETSIKKVQGDFRQEEILRHWKRVIFANGTRFFPCASIHISCSSGTYARSIAERLGEYLHIPALALHILRTKVGEYDIENSLK